MDEHDHDPMPHDRSPGDPIPFPLELARRTLPSINGQRSEELPGLPSSADHVIDALDTMSRRIDDLARELNVFGHFDDDDGPRAA
ncbi:MAG: hypothetical protein AB8G96_13540 [Phycisphaerales bacterium]